MTSASVSLSQDAKTISLIGLAHGTSHFFHMLLPPLFVMFHRDLGYSYSELGLLMTTFFVVSGIGQALAGFLVDRVGARPVLFAALGCFVVAAFATATATGFGGLVLAAAIAGLGNSPFHPVDFTILNKRVSQPRLGHAFSVHGITGNLGWAAAPMFLGGVTALTGSWRTAAAGMGVWALFVIVVLWLNREAIDDKAGQWAHEAVPAKAAAATAEHPLAFLRLPSVWLCFSFFFWSTCAISAIQASAGPALMSMYGLPETITPIIVTGYMLCGAAGMVVGGFIASRVERLERIIATCLMASALLLCLTGSGLLPGMAATAVAALAGFGTGLAGPSRDMLIKQAAPPGATGRVYGAVYSGLDLGFAIAAPIFGAMVDHGMARGVFYGAALSLALGVGSASLVGLGVAQLRGARKVAA